MEPVTKLWWQSKTAWSNILVGGLAAFFPEAIGKLMTPENFILLVSFANIILRAVSKDAIARQVL